jgi:putative membrane protein
MKTGVFVALAALLATGATAADDDTSGRLTPEQAFVSDASRDGLLEVELGKLAQKRGTDPMVREFGAQMVRDHEKANAELRKLAEAKGLQVPTSLDGERARMSHRLSAKPQSEFDAEYGKQMTMAHEAAITLFSDAAALRDKELVAFAEKTLPTLRHHKGMAERLPTSKPSRTDESVADPTVTDPTATPVIPPSN